MLLLTAMAALVSPVSAADPPPGFHAEVKVEAPTRLDWEFAVAGFGADAVKLPGEYDSKQQRYQLHVPKAYDKTKRWPLIIFISPGDDPLGWRYWQKSCEDRGMFFCAAYAAGNSVHVGVRTRIVLDVLDDVRRRYRIDPDQTIIAGFSGGGRMACALAFALPEYFGGVIPVCGTNPLHAMPYLRHRVRDRLSVAFVTGETDFNRRENEAYMAPYFQEVEVRSKLWLVKKMGHSIPNSEVLAEVHAWIAEDLKRRQADTQVRPGLVAPEDGAPTMIQQANRHFEAAEADLKQPERTWRGVALLQGVVTRWGKTSAADKARKLLTAIEADKKQAALLAEQKGAEERREWSAQAKALERFALRRRAVDVWKRLAKEHPDSPEGRKAADEIKRLEDAIAATPKQPYLGAAFKGETTTIAQVAPNGPAGKAGLLVGDTLLQLGDAKVATVADFLKALQEQKAGAQVAIEVKRGDRTMTLKVTLGSRTAPGDE